jgi:D-3-phosphoglycerate dehydrogenase / 2-oxoglutarate reductase
MLVYATEADELDQDALALLRSNGFEVLADKTQALARANDVAALFVRTYTTVDAAYLDQFKKVKYVLRAGVGLDNIDTAECKKRGITVINSPGANANAVAEYVVATVLFALRRAPGQEARLRQGKWRSRDLMGGEIKNKTLALVGCGNVGKMIARKLSSFELKEIVGYDPYLSAEQLAAAGIRKVELAEAIASADILSLHVPLMPETRHLLGAKEFALMKPGAIVINAARGGVVDEQALAAAITSGQLDGAALDVFETEPKVAAELLLLPNVILTPHIAGFTHEADKEVSLAPARELIRLAKGVSVV